MRVSSSLAASRTALRVMDFPKLTGGLNLRELSYRLNQDESPAMRNLWWQDGVLQSRDGQRYLTQEALGTGYACCATLFFGCAFYHVGGKLYACPMGEDMAQPVLLTEGVPENRGTFFRYLDWLFYKNRGGFFRISYDPEADQPFTTARVEELAYTPVILLNASPAFGTGSTYQPENRLSPRKTVRYNAEQGVKVYHLPVQDVEAVEQVKVDGAVKTAPGDYTVDLAAGTVTFAAAPPVTTPPTNNTVEITYRKANPDALASVMDCPYAFVAGGDRNLSILLAGCQAQPNAVFWNSNDNLSMNPGYFPMSYYNLVGGTEDPVTGFGRQYSDTIVLKEHSVGKLNFSVEEVDGRDSISFAYTSINDKIGCDLPWSIQLIENNLVFCNTYQGVHIVRSSSAAYENNVECISLKVNAGTGGTMGLGGENGLLHDVRAGGGAVSFDDDSRYWLCANGHGYLWDYTISELGNPSWFFQTELYPVAFFHDDTHRAHHLDASGRLTRFGRYFSDYGRGIDKRYQIPVLNFGTYDRLKDVTEVLITTRSDTETQIEIQYDTDYGTWTDATEIQTWEWTWKNMDLGATILGYYNLEAPRYARVARRRPGLRHIRHFTMTLSNARAGEDLALVSAQVFYRMQGRER